MISGVSLTNMHFCARLKSPFLLKRHKKKKFFFFIFVLCFFFFTGMRDFAVKEKNTENMRDPRIFSLTSCICNRT